MPSRSGPGTSVAGGRPTTRRPPSRTSTSSWSPRVGGRFFERTSDGREVDWGEVLVWEPPERFVYTWHLKRDREDATEVEIRFVPTSEATTRVEIEHRGWERLGSDGPAWRDRNRGGWDSLLPHYIAALAAGG